MIWEVMVKVGRGLRRWVGVGQVDRNGGMVRGSGMILDGVTYLAAMMKRRLRVCGMEYS